MRLYCIIISLLLAFCLGCQWQSPASGGQQADDGVQIERYDCIERNFVTLADFAALHQLRTEYPEQTRTLIEDVLKLGPANDPDINTRLLLFFQDSTLQALVADVEQQYGDISDLEAQLTKAFKRLGKMLPGFAVPQVYAQIGSLDQSIVVTDSLLGISLDKYLGADYPVYKRYGYTEKQRNMMTRKYIVPDCLGFYLLSLYPMSEEADSVPELRRWHMSKIQSVVNQAMGRKIFANDNIEMLARYRQRHPHTTTHDLLMLDRHLPMVEEKR